MSNSPRKTSYLYASAPIKSQAKLLFLAFPAHRHFAAGPLVEHCYILHTATDLFQELSCGTCPCRRPAAEQRHLLIMAASVSTRCHFTLSLRLLLLHFPHLQSAPVSAIVWLQLFNTWRLPRFRRINNKAPAATPIRATVAGSGTTCTRNWYPLGALNVSLNGPA